MLPYIFLLFQKLDGWIIANDCFSYDFIKGNKGVLPESGISGIFTVVSEHEVTVFRHCVRTIISGRYFWYKTVIQRFIGTVYVDFSVTDFNSLTRKSDQTFDKQLAFVIRELEDDDIKTFRVFCLV